MPRHEPTTSRMDGPARPRYVLRPAPPVSAAGVLLDPAQRAVIDHDRGRLKVLAGPGTGKTATLVEAVAARVKSDVDPASLLVLTFSRAAAAELAQRIAARVDVTVREPMVRTLHGYAYALVRAAADAAGTAAPTLLPAGQADMVVREILAGHADDGGRYWPVDLHAALRVPAFAAELRDLMLRVAERQVTARQIARAAAERNRPEWEAVARFIDEYRDIADLRQGTTRLGAKLDQAELMVAALERLEDPSLLAAQQRRVRRIFVDEYQDVDPAQAALIERLAVSADEVVVVGDPDQAIYSFRGAVAGAMERFEADQTVSLTVTYRIPEGLIEPTRRIAEALPGPRDHRALRAARQPATEGETAVNTSTAGAPTMLPLDVRVLTSANQEAMYVADQLRRAHLHDEIPWHRMAVVLRAPKRSGEALRRALVAAGVPVADRSVTPLAAEPLVAALLTVLRAGVNPERLTGTVAAALLGSPLGRMDPVALRRLRRSLRHSTSSSAQATPSLDLVAEILLGRRELPATVPPEVAMPVRRMTNLIALAASGSGDPAAEGVLWRVWQSAGVVDSLVAASERGGLEGARADAHLDAVVELFGRAAALADDMPFPGIGGLLGMLDEEQLADSAVPADHGDAVTITSAHASKGLEWDVVAIAAVQEEQWPDLRQRRSLLRYDELIDAVAGIAPGLPAAGRLPDERRLFYVAATRAQRRLIVTATQDAESTPSRFLAEISGQTPVAHGWPADADRAKPMRSLNLPALVAELRSVLCGGDGEHERRRQAANVLAHLAAAGVDGAHPRDWYGLDEISTDRPLVPTEEAVSLSPSQVESLQQCPLRSVLERQGGRTPPEQPQLLGIAVHAIAQGMALGASEEAIDQAMDDFLSTQAELPPWERARLGRRMAKMRAALTTWLANNGADRTLVGAEVPIDVTVPAVATVSNGAAVPNDAATSDRGASENGGIDERGTDPWEYRVDGAHRFRLRGRIDWLSQDDAGRVVITDFKTGSTKPTKAEAVNHPQLAAYQLALALGGLAQSRKTGDTSGDFTGRDAVGEAWELGGAELVYLASGRPELREQPPQSPTERQRWLGALGHLAAEAAGIRFTARKGSHCDRCPVRSSCPIQPEGRQVTGR